MSSKNPTAALASSGFRICGITIPFAPALRDSSTLVRAIAAPSLEIGGKIALSLERQLGRLTDPDVVEVDQKAIDCSTWEFYCISMQRAVKFALRKGKKVLVVGQPYKSDTHVQQVKLTKNFLIGRKVDHPNLFYVSLGEKVDLKDRSLSFDGLHPTQKGNRIIARNLTPILLKILHQTGAR